MNTQEIAHRLVELCRKGDFENAFKELYSPKIRSVEAEGVPNREVQGFEALAKKGEEFNEMFEVHGTEVSDPLVAGNFFSVSMKLDATHKPSGQKMPMDEVCVYEVSDGKIVLEQFFYPAPPQS